MKIESNKNWTTCLRLNTGDGSPRVFLLNSHFLGSVPIPSDYFYNRCYGAPVQACSLAPSKLQTRSTGLVLTPRNSHSMRFPITAIIKSARFFVIRVLNFLLAGAINDLLTI